MNNDDQLMRDLQDAVTRLDDALLAMDLAAAQYGHTLRRCQRLAGDAQALLEEADA